MRLLITVLILLAFHLTGSLSAEAKLRVVDTHHDLFKVALNLETISVNTLEGLKNYPFKECDPLLEKRTGSYCHFRSVQSQWDKITLWIDEQASFNEDTFFNDPSAKFESKMIDIGEDWTELDLQGTLWSFSITFDNSNKGMAREVTQRILSWSLLKAMVALELDNLQSEFEKLNFKASTTTSYIQLPALQAWVSGPYLHKQVLTYAKAMSCGEREHCLKAKAAITDLVCSQINKYQTRSQIVKKALENDTVFNNQDFQRVGTILGRKVSLNREVNNFLNRIVSLDSGNSQILEDFRFEDSTLLDEIIDIASLPIESSRVIASAYKANLVQSVIEESESCKDLEPITDAQRVYAEKFPGYIQLKEKVEKEIQKTLRYFELEFDLIPGDMNNV